jgi:DNA-directed RNA polymerase specialized sigma24 family protein
LACDPLSALPEDAALLAGLAEAKPEAFHRFFEAWFPRVYAFAWRELENRPLAEAATRRTLRNAVVELPRLDPTTPLAAWLLAHLRREIAWARRGTPP